MRICFKKLCSDWLRRRHQGCWRISRELEASHKISNGKKNNLTTGHGPATCTCFPILEESPHVSSFDVEETLSAVEASPSSLSPPQPTRSSSEERISVMSTPDRRSPREFNILSLYLVYAGFRQMLNKRVNSMHHIMPITQQ